MDNSTRYGTVTRILHWSIAVLLLWQFAGVLSGAILGEKSALAEALSADHVKIGTIVYVLVVIRILWSLLNIGKRPPASPGLLGYLGRLGHFLLYVLMFIVPLAALLRAWGGARAFAPFGFEIFPARSPETVVKWATDFGSNFHGELGWVFLILAFGHIAMALFHHFILKDGLLNRMK